jgi:hypothetical protein
MNEKLENWILVSEKLKQYGIENDLLCQDLINMLETAYENGIDNANEEKN